MLTRGNTNKGEGFVQEQDVIDEVVKEYENNEGEDSDGGVGGANDEDDDDSVNDIVGGDENGEDEDDDDDGMDNGLEEIDPQVLKLQERIKFLRHRCISSLGN